MSPEHQKLFQNLMAENLKLSQKISILENEKSAQKTQEPESSGINPSSCKKAKLSLENAKIPEKKPKILVKNASGLGLELSKEFLRKCFHQIDSDTMSPEQKDIFENLLYACLTLSELGAEKDEIRNKVRLEQKERFDNWVNSVRTNNTDLWKNVLEPMLNKSNK